jgi:chitin disaccharide deacetylase
VRRLIINADDFGLTAGVNRAILHAHQDRVVTSATLMAGGKHFQQAIQLAGSASKLSVGCHVVLIDGNPVRTDVPSLLRPGGANHHQFRTSLYSFAMAALATQMNPDHIEAEAVAQIRQLQSAGINVSHIDTHKHTHVFPSVLESLLRAARACGIRAIRNPFPLARGWLQQVRHTPALAKRFLQVQVLRAAFYGNFNKQIRQAGLAAPDGCLGVIETGYLDECLLHGIIEAIPSGTWELVCHPGYNDAELAAANTRLRQSRAQELQLLTSPATRAVLTQRGIELISYHDFVASTPSGP